MLLIQANNIEKRYGERLVLACESVSVYSGERVGIVGANGAGKTTLLRMLLGQLEPDAGEVELRCRYAYIDQMEDEGGDADPVLLSEFAVADKVGAEGRSGGEVTRLKIAAALSENVPLLACDEPTCNLDLEGIERLTKRLRAYPGALLLISHDRAFLDGLCDRLLEVADGGVTEFYGNYSAYRAQAEARDARKRFEYEQFLEEKARLGRSIVSAKGRAASVRKAPKRMGNSEARLHKRAATEIAEKLSNTAKSLESRLSQLEEKEKPVNRLPLRIDLSLTNPPENRAVIAASGLRFAYGERVLFENASFEVVNRCKTALVGANGAGKTTLLRLITEGNPAIRVVPAAKLGYFAQRFENLDPKRSILENVQRHAVQPPETVRTVLARMSFRRDDVYKPVGVLSGGERIKASIAQLVVSDCNVLVLDEPTNFLDIESIEALQEVLRAFEGAVLFVSHDRAFIDAVADRLLIVGDGAVTPFKGNYTAWRESLAQTHSSVRRTDERLLLELRVAELTAKIGSNPPDREALEAEWQALVARRRALDEGQTQL